ETATAKEQETSAPAEQAPAPAAPPPPPQIERPKPTITTTERGAPPAPGRTEVKPLHRRDAPAATRGDGGLATAEDLRRTKSSPLGRKMAKEPGIDTAQFEGPGMSGRATKNAILSSTEPGAPAPARAAPQATAAAAPAAQPSIGAPGTQQVTVLKPGAGDRVEQM